MHEKNISNETLFLCKDGGKKDLLLESALSSAFYFQVKRLIDRQFAVSKPGYSGAIASEAVLFGTNSSLGFPLRDVQNIRYLQSGQTGLPQVEMTVNFAGLCGSSSPLPEFYSEDVIYSKEDISPSGKFLDFFNHRLISFFYRSWENVRSIDEYELGASNKYCNYLFSMFGMRGREFRDNSDINWERLLPYALFFRIGPVSASSLKKVLAHYFCLESVSVRQFIKKEAAFRPQDTNSLGLGNTNLGDNCSIGNSITQLNSCYRLILGSLSYRQFRNFLPDRAELSILRKLASLLIRKPISMQVELNVDSSDIPQMVLANANIFQLGYNSWLGKPTEPQFTLIL
ncbi:MAG: type VI secretion system baseplate subunit TssG [Thiohalomonadales bacterium]